MRWFLFALDPLQVLCCWSEVVMISDVMNPLRIRPIEVCCFVAAGLKLCFILKWWFLFTLDFAYFLIAENKNVSRYGHQQMMNSWPRLIDLSAWQPVQLNQFQKKSLWRTYNGQDGWKLHWTKWWHMWGVCLYVTLPIPNKSQHPQQT